MSAGRSDIGFRIDLATVRNCSLVHLVASHTSVLLRPNPGKCSGPIRQTEVCASVRLRTRHGQPVKVFEAVADMMNRGLSVHEESITKARLAVLREEIDSIHFTNVMYWREGTEHSVEARAEHKGRQRRLREIGAAQRALACEGGHSEVN
jgi:hypothetical protein